MAGGESFTQADGFGCLARLLPSFIALALSFDAGCDDSGGVDLSGRHDATGLQDGGTGASLDSTNEPGLDGGGLPNPTLVVLPDTQFYAAAYPEIFYAQAQWILDHRASSSLVAVLHEGDLVDDSSSLDQWQVASDAFAKLDGMIPYLVLAGNHDESLSRQGYMDQYFPAARFEPYSWFGGMFEAGKSENGYAIVAIGDTLWLLLALEFGPRNAVVTWADGILKSNADKPAVLVTHAYLYNDGTRYDNTKVPPQSFDPHDYNYTPLEGVNDGEELWRQLVLGNENLKLVLSGHCLGDPANLKGAAARLSSVRPSGSTVHQILANYQTCADMTCPEMPQIKGGNGYLRLIEFDKAQRMLRVHTYSPYLNQYLVTADDDFVLPWP